MAAILFSHPLLDPFPALSMVPASPAPVPTASVKNPMLSDHSCASSADVMRSHCGLAQPDERPRPPSLARAFFPGRRAKERRGRQRALPPLERARRTRHCPSSPSLFDGLPIFMGREPLRGAACCMQACEYACGGHLVVRRSSLRLPASCDCLCAASMVYPRTAEVHSDDVKRAERRRLAWWPHAAHCICALA